jgi:hypothetical protein
VRSFPADVFDPGIEREVVVIVQSVNVSLGGPALSSWFRPPNAAVPQRTGVFEEVSLVSREGDPIRPSPIVILVDRNRREEAPLTGSRPPGGRQDAGKMQG